MENLWDSLLAWCIGSSLLMLSTSPRGKIKSCEDKNRLRGQKVVHGWGCRARMVPPGSSCMSSGEETAQRDVSKESLLGSKGIFLGDTVRVILTVWGAQAVRSQQAVGSRNQGFCQWGIGSKTGQAYGLRVNPFLPMELWFRLLQKEDSCLNYQLCLHLGCIYLFCVHILLCCSVFYLWFKAFMAALIL